MPAQPHVPAYQRLTAEERRRRLLALGVQLFTEHAYDELSMTDIARAAGITKAALYHYFPNQQTYFVATLMAATAEVQALVDTEPDRPVRERIDHGLEAYLAWIDANRRAYAKLIRSVHAAEEIRTAIDAIRSEMAARIADAIDPAGATARTHAAVAGWLWFIDGACLDWINGRDLSRDELKRLLLGALDGALA